MTSANTEKDRLSEPKVVRESVLTNIVLRDSLCDISVDTGVSEQKLEKEADRYLRELVPASSRLGYRLMIRFARFVYRRGYDEKIVCNEAEVERYRELLRHHPVALLGNHRSQVDGWASYTAMHEHGLPHPFSFGGINMKLPVWGTLLKSARLVFIRRGFSDNLVYKAVLTAYIDFLVENRFPLYWSIEGTRSRTGKLTAPRFGLLNWVLGDQHRASREDLHLVPVVVSYEQIADVQSYSEEQRGMKKKPESLKWMLDYLSSLKQPMGQISVHFGEAVSVRWELELIRQDAPELLADRNKVLLKLAIAACLKMNEATPVTVTSLACLVLLQAAPKAVTLKELEREFLQLVSYVKANGWPATFDPGNTAEAQLKRSLDALETNGVIQCFDQGAEAVYSISAGKDLSASYYRNNGIHFFVNGAISELALAKALAEQDPERRETSFWNEIQNLRKLFKFEFYFPPDERFISAIRSDLDLRCPGWQAALASDTPYPWKELDLISPLLCHGVLESFVDAYQIVADNLVRQPPGEAVDQGAFVGQCLADAEQLYRLRRISHPETVAKAMFESGLLVAKSRGLVDELGDLAVTDPARRAFQSELQALSKRLQNIRHIAAARRSG